MSRRNSKHRLPGRPDAIPFASLADAAERVGQAYADLIDHGVRLVVSADRQHWKVDDADGRVCEWWPSTGRFVVQARYENPQRVGDVDSFLAEVKRILPGQGRLPLGARCPHPCGECGAAMVLRDSRLGLFYGCSTFPACRSTHGAHKSSGKPLGIPADKPTKAERMAAHAVFDRLWMGEHPPMGRREAYAWMAEKMGLTKDEAHIGRFDATACQRLRDLVREHFPTLGQTFRSDIEAELASGPWELPREPAASPDLPDPPPELQGRADGLIAWWLHHRGSGR